MTTDRLRVTLGWIAALGLALTAMPRAAYSAPAGCTGNVRAVWYDSDATVHVVLSPDGGNQNCSCTRLWNGAGPHFQPPSTSQNKQQIFTTALAAATTGSTIAVWMDPALEAAPGSNS